jgi:NAD-dependent SIR2 family protein deacetylase
MSTQRLCDEAARLIQGADGLMITAGAGMGVDSGLPDFRGNAGLWRAYPALAGARIAFEEIASPDAFVRSPALAWGFYGHRLNLYRRTVPHPGFAILQAIGARLPRGSFVFTSNVDGQFQRAGFDENRVCEGARLHPPPAMPGRLRRAHHPSRRLRAGGGRRRLPAALSLPRCTGCQALLRPNVLMFGDWGWLSQRTAAQRRRLEAWLGGTQRAVVIEIGAGLHVPTVRWFSETLGEPLIRINPTEPDIPGRGVSLPVGGLAALEGIQQALSQRGFFER